MSHLTVVGETMSMLVKKEGFFPIEILPYSGQELLYEMPLEGQLHQ